MPKNLRIVDRIRLAFRVLLFGEVGDAVRAATLEMDLKDRDQQLERMRREFELEHQRADSQAAEAGDAEIEALVKRLASPLSNLSAMASRHRSGEEVRLDDVFRLFERLENELAERGLERIGEVGSQAGFDPGQHQRLSGGNVGDGDPVRVRFVGYRFAGKVLTKAMVTRVASEEENGVEE